MPPWLWIALAVALVLLYRRFSPKIIPGVPYYDHHPIIGNWPGLFPNQARYHDWKLDYAKRAVAEGAEMIQRRGPFLGLVEVLSPRNLQYMLKDNFDGYEKGASFRAIFEQFLGNGIFNSDSDHWRATRKTASHMFSASKLNNFMLECFLRHIVTLVDVLDEKRVDKSEVDLQQLFLKFTMDVITEVGFGMHMGSMRAKVDPPFVKAFDQVQEATVWRFMGPSFKYKLYRMFGLRTEKQMAQYLPVIDEFVYGIIASRKANAAMYEGSADLMSLFLADAAKSGAELNDKELRDLVLSFMLAGRDTTASLLSWLFQELCQRPQLRAQLLEEIDAVFGAVPDESSAASIAGINEVTLKQALLLEAVLMETLRLHPPVAGDNKRSIGESTFPDGTKVPANYLISYSPYVFGRLESIWGADVAEFRPERWLSEADANGKRTLVQKSTFAFPMFNAGPRLCLGRSMALMEAKAVAVALLRKFRFDVRAGHDPHYRLSIILFMRDGLPVTVYGKE